MYIQRQIAGERDAKTHFTYGQRYSHTSQTQAVPRASLLSASPESCAGSDATNAPTTVISAPKSAPTTSSLQCRPPSAIIVGQTPLLKLIEPALMPEYNVVHNHCFRNPRNFESGEPNIMQSYDYGPLNIPAIGFQASTTHRRVRAPPRKVTDLESLPPSSEVAAEIVRKVKVQEQAGVLAAIQERESERHRKARRAAQTRLPPCVAPISSSYSAKDLEAAHLSEPPPTPLVRPKLTQLRTQPDQPLGQVGHHDGDARKQGHVRWAPKPVPQRRRDSTALDKKGHRGKQTRPRNESKRP